MKYRVYHHSGVDVDSTAQQVYDYHVKTLGWGGLGYYFLIHMDGAIDYVGDIATTRANVAKRNHEVVGVCLLGNFNEHPPTEAQLAAAHRLDLGLSMLMPWSEATTHRQIALPGYGTSCPGSTYLDWIGRITG